MKLYTIICYLSFIFAFIKIIHTKSNSKSLKDKKTNFNNFYSEQKTQRINNFNNHTQKTLRINNFNNHTISRASYASLNKTFVKKDFNTFKNEFNHWDYKLLSSQFEDIFSIFLFQNNQQITPESLRAVIHLFVSNFEKCDLNKDNTLDLTEFQKCIRTNKYFKLFNIDSESQPKFVQNLINKNKRWTNISDTDSLAENIFNLMDEWGNKSLNFYDFLMLRLVSFAWRKCGNLGYFINEINFECAYETFSKGKTLLRNSARTLYNYALEFSNYKSSRYIDLLTFIKISLKGRLFAKLNAREDGNLVRSEFIHGLESNILPIRYSKEIIDSFFDLIGDSIDIYTFIFFDELLRMFDLDLLNRNNKCVSYNEFRKIILHHSFPKKLIHEFYFIPFFNPKSDDFRKFIAVKINKLYNEQDFLMRFRSLSNKQNTTTTTVVETTTTTISNNSTSKKDILGDSLYFNSKPRLHFDFTFATDIVYYLMDFPQKDCVEFKDYAYFMHVAFIFKQFDKYKVGKLSVQSLIEKFGEYSGFAQIGKMITERMKNLKLIKNITYLNVFYTYVLLRVDDLVNRYSHKDLFGFSINEINMKKILDRANIENFPDDLIRTCIRSSVQKTNIEYDWTCVISIAVESVCKYIEYMEGKNMIKRKNIKLVNTDFYKH
jgi:hypothetical protein